MFSRLSFICLFAFPFQIAVAVSTGWPTPSPGDGYPWQFTGNYKAGHWFDEFQSVLATMQNNYFNGTAWPSSIQWISAFLDTLLAASDISLTNALVEYDGKVPGSHTRPKTIHHEIEEYFSQIEAFYGGEDTIQIFGAAYDDAQWVVLEWLEAIKFIDQYNKAFPDDKLGKTDIARFAHRAHIFYNIVADKFNTTLCDGGLTWNPALAPYKNAITNELFVSSSIGMYLYFPGDSNTNPYPSPSYTNTTNMTLPPLQPLHAHDPSLLDNAIKEYQWFKTHNFTNAQGLIVDGFHISDNQTTCDERNEMVYSYNQGVVLSGLRQLWEATGDVDYLQDGYALIETVINATDWYATDATTAAQWAGLGRNGIMEDYCDASATCGEDNLMFKGIYFHHLDLFCEPLPTKSPLIPSLTKTASHALAARHNQHCRDYTPWVEHNAFAALSTRNSTGIIENWWGVSYPNATVGTVSKLAVLKPHGSIDEVNDPWVLRQTPWICQPHHECYSSRRHTGGKRSAMARLFDSRKTKRAAPGQWTVETEGSGLGVVKAASDLRLKRPAT